MRWAIFILFICVFAGTTAGYLVGSNLSDKRGVGTILANTQVARVGDNKFALNYVCHDQVLVSFDVDSDKLLSRSLSPKEFVEFLLKNKNYSDSNYKRVYDSIITFTMGGGAIKFARPLVTTLKSKENTKYTVPGMIGALSGFYLGFELATRVLPPCEDPGVVSLVQDPNIWVLLKQSIASQFVLQEMLLSVVQLDTKRKGFEEAIMDVTNKKVTSQTFAKLFEISAYTPPTNEPDPWYSAERVLTIYVPVGILIVGAGFAAFLIAQQLQKQAARRAARRKNAQ